MKNGLRCLIFTLIFIAGCSNLEQNFSRSPAGKKPVTQFSLAKKIVNSVSQVKEFRMIKELANEMGVEVYLFGKSAASYAHYVKWSMEFTPNRGPHSKNIFDFNYTQIFDRTHRLELIVDGSQEQTKIFQEALNRKLPFLSGKRRSLCHSTHFLKEAGGVTQVSSHSDAMIELTSTSNRKIRGFNSTSATTPQFLENITKGRLPLHRQTEPTIENVVKYLRDVFDYGLEIPPESKRLLKKFVANFDPTKSSVDPKWLQSNVLRLIARSRDLERVWTVLDETGLRKKLMHFGSLYEAGSVAWWMNKVPLKSNVYPNVTGGKTAKFTLLHHHTRTFQAYESLTRDHVNGRLNAFISREGIIGEKAEGGDGLYTYVVKDRDQFRSFGYGVFIKPDPDAIEGKHFYYAKDVKGSHEIVVIIDRSKFKVVHEKLDDSVFDFFEKIFKGEGFLAREGAIEVARRKFRYQTSYMTSEQKDKLYRTVRAALDRGDDIATESTNKLLHEWFELPLSLEYPDILQDILKNHPHFQYESIMSFFKHIDDHVLWATHPKRKKLLSSLSQTLITIMNDPKFRTSPFISSFLDKWFSMPFAHEHGELFTLYIDHYIENVFHRKSILALVFENKNYRKSKHFREWVSKILSDSTNHKTLWNRYLDEDLIDIIIDFIKDNPGTYFDKKIIEHLRNQTQWHSNPRFIKWLETLIEMERFNKEIFQIFAWRRVEDQKVTYKCFIKWIQLGKMQEEIIGELSKRPNMVGLADRVQLIDTLVKEGKWDKSLTALFEKDLVLHSHPKLITWIDTIQKRNGRIRSFFSPLRKLKKKILRNNLDPKNATCLQLIIPLLRTLK